MNEFKEYLILELESLWKQLGDVQPIEGHERSLSSVRQDIDRIRYNLEEMQE